MVDIYKIIACPICKSKLVRKTDVLICAEHGEFPISKNGIPILLINRNDTLYKTGEKEYKNENRNKFIIFIKTAIFKKPKLYWGKSLHDKLREKYIDKAPQDKVILNVGSGHEKKFDQKNFINLDIYPHWNTHVVGDAHALPFLNDSVDIVWLCAVLMHLENPNLAMEEIYRVLKPEGLVLISVPFIEYKLISFNDYYRFSTNGLRKVCERFVEIESGPSYSGPFGTIIHLCSVLPDIFFVNKVVKNGLSFLLAWLLSPLLIFDLLVREQCRREILSGASCYLGKKL